MNPDQYKALTDKGPLKKKPRTRPLPKAGEKYLEAFDRLKEILNRMEIKYEEYFHFKSTKHWRFDFHLIEYRMLIEIAGGPWSGGRKGKLATKAWSMDRYDHANEMGFTVVRLESANRYKIDESGPLQIEAQFASQWLKNLKRESLNGPVQTIPAVKSD
ncbi:hypothetical protein [Acinetobacter sp. G11]|uniref:hypothetical protein n=1 Tax=Acinetobacter sp. G11 TaxID=3415989 RepID=UPI003C7B6C18